MTPDRLTPAPGRIRCQPTNASAMLSRIRPRVASAIPSRRSHSDCPTGAGCPIQVFSAVCRGLILQGGHEDLAGDRVEPAAILGEQYVDLPARLDHYVLLRSPEAGTDPAHLRHRDQARAGRAGAQRLQLPQPHLAGRPRRPAALHRGLGAAAAPTGIVPGPRPRRRPRPEPAREHGRLPRGARHRPAGRSHPDARAPAHPRLRLQPDLRVLVPPARPRARGGRDRGSQHLRRASRLPRTTRPARQVEHRQGALRLAVQRHLRRLPRRRTPSRRDGHRRRHSPPRGPPTLHRNAEGHRPSRHPARRREHARSAPRWRPCSAWSGSSTRASSCGCVASRSSRGRTTEETLHDRDHPAHRTHRRPALAGPRADARVGAQPRRVHGRASAVPRRRTTAAGACRARRRRRVGCRRSRQPDHADPPPGGVLPPRRRRQADRVRRVLHGRRLGRPGPRWLPHRAGPAHLHPRSRAAAEAARTRRRPAPRGRARRRGEHPRQHRPALRPVQRHVRHVPRRDDDLQLGAVRRPAADGAFHHLPRHRRLRTGPGVPDVCRPRARPAPQARPAARPDRRRPGHPGARDRHRLGRAVHPRRASVAPRCAP